MTPPRAGRLRTPREVEKCMEFYYILFLADLNWQPQALLLKIRASLDSRLRGNDIIT